MVRLRLVEAENDLWKWKGYCCVYTTLSSITCIVVKHLVSMINNPVILEVTYSVVGGSIKQIVAFL